MKREERKVENGLRLDVQRVLTEEGKIPGVLEDDIRTFKANLERIDEKKYKGPIVRARAERLLVGETPTKRTFVIENKDASCNQIAEIDHRGTVTGNRDLIQQAFVK